jgi:predicted amidohydrolase
MDDDQLKNGCSMIIDPFGDVIAECRSFDDTFALATVSRQKVLDAGGTRYLNARRPEIYREIIGKEHTSNQEVIWLNKKS